MLSSDGDEFGSFVDHNTPLPLSSSNCELPPVARYLPGQFYAAHFDAFDVSTVAGQGFVANGGQRTHTVLVYLNDVPAPLGGGTTFHAARLRGDLRNQQPPPGGSVEEAPGGSVRLFRPPSLSGLTLAADEGGQGVTVQPKKGAAVVFFPSHYVYDDVTGARAGVKLDNQGLHEARPVLDEGIKFVSQVWVRAEKGYNGMESKRLLNII